MIENNVEPGTVQVFLFHGFGLRFILVVEVLLVHQYYVVVRYGDLRQPGMVSTCQIDFLERQAQSHSDRRYQHVMRTGNAPAFAEYPVAETLEAFDRRCIINIELDGGVTRQ